MSDDRVETEPTQGLDEIIASKIESLLPTLLARTGGSSAVDHSQERLEDRGKSPASSVPAPSEAGSAGPRRSAIEQPNSSNASGLANRRIRGRNSVTQGHTRVTKGRGKPARGRKKGSCSSAYYIVFEDDIPLRICKGWLAARRASIGWSGRWTQRFETKEEAEDYMEENSTMDDQEEEED